MRVVASDGRRVDPLSVTAQFPAVDAYAFGPYDPNPYGGRLPDMPLRQRPPGRVSHLGGALAAAIVTAGLIVAANYGATQLLIAVAAAQGLLVLPWVFGTAVPGRLGAVVVGLAIPAMFIHQLTRGVVRTRVVESLSDLALLVVAVVALPAYMQLGHEMLGTQLVTAVALAAGCALVAGH